MAISTRRRTTLQRDLCHNYMFDARTRISGYNTARCASYMQAASRSDKVAAPHATGLRDSLHAASILHLPCVPRRVVENWRSSNAGEGAHREPP